MYGLNLSEGEVILRRINSVVFREEKIGLDSGGGTLVLGGRGKHSEAVGCLV